MAYLCNLLLRGHERGASAGGMVRDPDWNDPPTPPQPMSAIVMGDMNFEPTCSIPDDLMDPRGSSLFMARSILREVQEGMGAC